jgi:hypothetical protein
MPVPVSAPVAASAPAADAAQPSMPGSVATRPIFAPMAPLRRAVAKVTVTPTAVGLLAVGAGGVKTSTVAEKGYTGNFTSTSTCAGIATVAPGTGAGPSLKETVTGVKAGSCAFTFSDKSKNKAVLNVTVTTTSLTLAGPLPSSHNAAVKITPPGTTSNIPLTSCASGCSVAVAAPVGNPTFGVVITDAGAHVLATHAAAASAILVGKANVVTITFVKTISSLVWGSIPSANAGTAFTPAKSVSLTAIDADGNTIVGTYAAKISVADSDATGATSLAINGGSAAGGLLKSTDALTLAYSGLAIVPATLTASSTGATTQHATFTPVLANIVYTGAKVSGNPEIDLYSNAPATPGFTATFTATQAGWTASPYSKPFTYTFAAIGGQANDCPNASNPAYAITPASGAAGTSFAVTASAQIQAAADPTPFAGECLMTIKGGGLKTQAVILTFTTSSIGVNGKHRPNK